MRDCAPVNKLAMQTLEVVYPLVVHIGCYSQTLNHVGENFKTPVLTDFMHSWLTLFSHSAKTTLLWKTQIGLSMPACSSTRWGKKWEVVKIVMVHLRTMNLLMSDDDNGLATRSTLQSFFDDLHKQALLWIEIAGMVDWGEPFVKATHFLEGDGPLALECYEGT